MTVIRVEKVQLFHFKNVEYGEITFPDAAEEKASIVGIYGQNGSGKTAFVDAFGVLEQVIMGRKLPDALRYFVSDDRNNPTKLSFQFLIQWDDLCTRIIYDFSLKKIQSSLVEKKDWSDTNDVHVVIDEENLDIRKKDTKVFRKYMALRNTSAGLSLPQKKYRSLLRYLKDGEVGLKVQQEVSKIQGISFIFSGLLQLLRSIDFQIDKESETAFFQVLLRSIEALDHYVLHDLFVLGTKSISLPTYGQLLLSVKDGNDIKGLPLHLIKSNFVPLDIVKTLEGNIAQMNIVLTELIPDISLNIRVLRDELSQDNVPGKVIELTTLRDGIEIPLHYESEGIKKIISILQLLFFVFSNPSATVIIDELDAGIFEYLLGEILLVIANSACGQLIFTSHNLRPLEILDGKCIVFTTVNKNNRYVRMPHIKASNNLRKMYYRHILLNHSENALYKKTTSSMALAFLAASGVLDD